MASSPFDAMLGLGLNVNHQHFSSAPRMHAPSPSSSPPSSPLSPQLRAQAPIPSVVAQVGESPKRAAPPPELVHSEKLQPTRSQRFTWKSKGIISVQPDSVGPNRDIVVSWRIPASEVSANSFDKSVRGTKNMWDWIGLYRARQRIDCAQGHILVREIKAINYGKRGAYSTYDRRTGEVYGRIRLRTPRGVGQYDFRYFRGSDVYPDTAMSPNDGVDNPFASFALQCCHCPS